MFCVYSNECQNIINSSSLASSPDFHQLFVAYSTEKRGKPGRISHVNDVWVERRVERTFEGDVFWTWQLTKQCNSSSMAAKTMKQEFVDNWRIALTTVIA